MRKTWNKASWLSAGVLGAAVLAAIPAAAQQPTRRMPPGFDPKRHMSVEEVVPGMKGFGRSVYHGTEIETFEVEVLSVEHGNPPGKAVVWARCTDDRMQKLGLVQGMSGSPVYLYPLNVDPARADPSQARLIGAFAFGYALAKNDCHVGIQPIEQMLAVATRARVPSESDATSATDKAGAQTTLAAMLAAARKLQLSDDLTWRMKAIAQLTNAQPLPARSEALSSRAVAIPVMAGPPALAELLQPIFQPMGLAAVPSQGAAPSGLPPDWISPEQVRPQPGGVGTVPLATGDMDLAAVGTITEILDDGTMLAFGHAMFGQGEINLPWGTGYVHFVQPHLVASFKTGGTLRVVGAMINDEDSAVVCKPDLEHPYRPSVVHVDWPDDSKDHTYHYQIARNRVYTPLLTMVTSVYSLIADTAPPDFSTLHVDATIKFDNGRSLQVQGVYPMSGYMGMVYDVLPALASLLDSPMGRLYLESFEATVRVEDKVRSAEITDLTVRQTTVEPGGSLKIDLQLLPFRGQPYSHHIQIDIPRDQPEGQYILTVGEARTYMAFQMETRPHLMRVENLDEQLEMVQYILNLRRNALYASLTPMDQQPQVAVGRAELPQLPSSRAAILLQPASSQATPYLHSLEKIEPMDDVIQGQMIVPILVQRSPQSSAVPMQKPVRLPVESPPPSGVVP